MSDSIRAALMTEAQLQEAIISRSRSRPGLALLLGWEVLHLRAGLTQEGQWRVPVQGSMGKGWPDLILARPPRLLAAELKSATGKLTQEQGWVLELLRDCGVEIYLWRPADWDRGEIEKILT